MPEPSPPSERPPKLTLFGVLTVAGDLLSISLLLFVFSLGVVTAAPAAVGAMRARRDVSPHGSSGPSGTMWRELRGSFRALWMVGPAAIVVAILSWVALAFWLTVPAPLSVVMIAVVTVCVAVCALIAFALPMARRDHDTLRSALRGAVMLIVGRPAASVLALFAFAAAIVLAVRFPAVGVVLLGGAFVEIAYRAWGERRSVGS